MRGGCGRGHLSGSGLGVSNKAVSDSGCGLQRHQVKSRLYPVPLFSLSAEGSVANE